MPIVAYDDTDAGTPYWVVLNSWGAPDGHPSGLWRLPMQTDYNATMNMAGSNYPMFQFWDLDIAFSVTTPCGYAISSPTAFPAGGGGQTLAVNASAAACPWTAATAADWLALSTTDGSGQTSLTLTASPNTGEARTATLTLAGVPLVVSQNGALPCPASEGRLRQTVAPQAAVAKRPGFCLSPDGRCFEFLEDTATVCLAPPSQTISFDALSGWTTPIDQTLPVVAGQEAHAVALYSKPPQKTASLLTLGLPASIAGSSAGTGGFDQRFSTNIADWLPNSFGSWAAMGGSAVNMGTPAKTDGLLTFGSQTFASLDYTVEMQRDGSSLATNYLYFRGAATPETDIGGISSGYLFGYDNAGSFVVGKLRPGTGWSALKEWTPSEALRPGGWNRLRARASGSDLRFYVNDVLVFSATDGDFAAAMSALASTTAAAASFACMLPPCKRLTGRQQLQMQPPFPRTSHNPKRRRSPGHFRKPGSGRPKTGASPAPALCARRKSKQDHYPIRRTFRRSAVGTEMVWHPAQSLARQIEAMSTGLKQSYARYWATQALKSVCQADLANQYSACARIGGL